MIIIYVNFFLISKFVISNNLFKRTVPQVKSAMEAMGMSQLINIIVTRFFVYLFVNQWFLYPSVNRYLI